MTRWATKPKKPIVGNQASIFDQRRKQAEIKAQFGIEASYKNAPTYWKQAARETVRELATNYQEFTTDMVWELLDKKGIYTGENRALGAIIQAAYRSGMIQKTGEYKESYRRHNAPIPVWRSNIFKGQA